MSTRLVWDVLRTLRFPSLPTTPHGPRRGRARETSMVLMQLSTETLTALDRALARRVNLATRKSQRLSSAASTLATTGSWAAATLLTLSWLRFWLTRRSQARHGTERAFLSVGLTYVVVEAIGRALPRVRPFAGLDDMLELVAHADRRSFPLGMSRRHSPCRLP